MTKSLKPADYLKKILTAKVYDVAIESPLEPAKALSRRLHNKVLLKREDQQPVFSFKLRGAYNKMAHLAPDSWSGASSAPPPATTRKASRWPPTGSAATRPSSCP